jgi:hypothetical protein
MNFKLASRWLESERLNCDRRDFGHLFGSNQRGLMEISPSEALRRLVNQLQIGG